jgi:uncharacterized membrane-anchored protein YitT (DUF2179 family)
MTNNILPFNLPKAFEDSGIIITRLLKDIVLIAVGIFSAAFGLESFLLPNKFIDGGATGISLLTAEITSIPLYYLLIIINLPFIFLAYKIVDRQFAIKTGIAITGLALSVAFISFSGSDAR